MNANLRQSNSLAWMSNAPMLGLLGMLAMFSACAADSPHRPVTEQEAAALLAEAVQLGRASDWDQLCQLAGDPYARTTCLYDARSLLSYEQFPFPSTNPAVVRSRTAPNGVVVLELCVTNNAGSFRNDFHVVRREGELVAPYPVYWISRMTTDAVTSGIRPLYAFAARPALQPC